MTSKHGDTFREHKRKQDREKLLVSKICQLPDAKQIKVLAFLKTLEMIKPP